MALVPRLGAALAALLVFVLTACGGGSPQPPSLSEVPLYPGAAPGQAMAGFAPGGGMGGNLQQYTTSDSYDEVLAFYTQTLASRQPQVLTHSTELGRQTAITLPQEKGAITVAIQEFTADRSVNITLMAVGQT